MKEIKVYFNIDEHEKLDSLEEFLPLYKYYNKNSKDTNPAEWGAIRLEEIIIRFIGFQPERLSEKTLKEDAIV
jgi:hypothetical protein